MILWLVAFSIFLTSSFAEVGKISKIIGSGDAYIQRNQDKITILENLNIEQGDELFSNDNVIVVYLYPTTQMSLTKNTQIKITKSLIERDGEKDKSLSIIDFIKGIVRLQVIKDQNLEIDQKVVADGVAFAVRGTEFEVSNEGEDFDLDVVEGEVEVSSPYVQTFVPEIVKANEGFRFNKKARNFQRRKFGMKFKNHPGFARKEEINQKWKQKRLQQKQKQKVRKSRHGGRQRNERSKK